MGARRCRCDAPSQRVVAAPRRRNVRATIWELPAAGDEASPSPFCDEGVAATGWADEVVASTAAGYAVPLSTVMNCLIAGESTLFFL